MRDRNRRSGNQSGQPRRRRQPRKSTSQVGTHTFTVEKPYCSPCRTKILQALQPFGVVVLNQDTSMNERVVKTDIKSLAQRFRIELKTFENIKYGGIGLLQYLPQANQAEVVVRKTQAGWAEDLLVASGWFIIINGHIPKRGIESRMGQRRQKPKKAWSKHTAQWASEQARYDGLNDRLSAIGDNEPQCQEAKAAWKQIINARDKVWDERRVKNGKQ